MHGYLVCYKLLTDDFNYKVKLYTRKKCAIKFYIKILREQIAAKCYSCCNIQEVWGNENFIEKEGEYLKGCFYNSFLKHERILQDKRRILKYYY